MLNVISISKIPKSLRRKVNEAIWLHNEADRDPEFIDLVRKTKFSHTTDPSPLIAARLCTQKHDIKIKGFYPGYWKRRYWRMMGYIVVARYIKKKFSADIIMLNTLEMKKLKTCDVHGDIGHEVAHKAGYHHGSNKQTSDKLSSVPVKIDELRGAYIPKTNYPWPGEKWGK